MSELGAIFIFVLGFLLAGGVGPLIIKWYARHNWSDDPEAHKHAKVLHAEAVPRGGGWVVFLSVLLGSALLFQFDKHLIGILAGALVMTVVGWWDDVADIHPVVRLGAGLLASLLVVGSGIGIAYVTNPFAPGVIHLNQPQLAFSLWGETHTIWILADIFAVFFIMWNMNIVNWSKGVDGQLPGFVSIALVFVGLLSYRFIDDPTQFTSANLAFLVAGAYAGLLVWNIFPQRMMPGYGAGSLGGYFLAVLAIVSGAKIATSLMVLGVPTADALFTIARRLRAGKSPLWGDRGHLHHKLLDVLGWSKSKIAIFYWVSTFALGFLALHLNTMGKMVTMGVVVAVVFGFLVWAKFVASTQKR